MPLPPFLKPHPFRHRVSHGSLSQGVRAQAQHNSRKLPDLEKITAAHACIYLISLISSTAHSSHSFQFSERCEQLMTCESLTYPLKSPLFPINLAPRDKLRGGPA